MNRKNDKAVNSKMFDLSVFYAFFCQGSRWFMGIRNLSMWFIILLVVLFFVNDNIVEFKSGPEKEQEFKKIQEEYFENIHKYEPYSLEGVKFLLIPSPAVVLFGNTVIPPDVVLKVNAIVTVQLNNNLKGKSLVSNLYFGRLDFSLIVLLGFSLLAMGYGHEVIQALEYLKCLSGIASHANIFLSVVLVRFILLAAGFLVLSGCVLVFLNIRGVVLTGGDYTGVLGSLVSALFMLLVFYMIGVFCGTLRSPVISILAMLGAWFTLTFLIPGTIVSLTGKKFPEVTRDFQTELDKFKIVKEFETRAAEEYGEFDKNNMDLARKVIEIYWNKYLKKIEAREEELKAEIQSNIDRVNRLSIIFPTTFYMHTCNEASSLGYGNFIDLYCHGQTMFRDFQRFWIDRVFYNDPKEMVSFFNVKGVDNIIRGKSRLPRYFAAGLALQLLYSVLLFLGSYFRFRRLLFPLPEKADAFDNLDIKLESHSKFSLRSGYRDFSLQFLGLFFGKSTGLKWNVSIDGNDIVNSSKKDFFYLPHPDKIPGNITVRHLLFLFKRLLKLPGGEFDKIIKGIEKGLLNKRFGKLETKDKAMLLLMVAQSSKRRVYLFNDFIVGIPGDSRSELAEKAEELKESGALLIDLVSTDLAWLEHDVMSTVHFKNKKYKEYRR